MLVFSLNKSTLKNKKGELPIFEQQVEQVIVCEAISSDNGTKTNWEWAPVVVAVGF